MFLIFEHHYEPSLGMRVMYEDGSNMLFETKEDALAFAETNCIHEFVIAEYVKNPKAFQEDCSSD